MAFSILFCFYKPARAVDCTTAPINGSLTISTSCSFPNTYDGVDAGTGTTNTAILTVSSGTLTVASGQTLSAGSVKFTGGSLFLIQTGQLAVGKPLYMKDADADGYPDSLSLITNTATTGYVRRSSLASLTLDCDAGATYSASNTCCSANGSACGADSTCCSAICGTNADGDGYFSAALGHSGTCQATTKPYTDCYDSNANAYPGEPNSYTVNRGDGSFDYNCDGAETGPGTHANCTCSACGSYGTIANCPSVSDPGCGQSYTAGTVSESYSGGTCYNNTGSFCTTYSGTVSCK